MTATGFHLAKSVEKFLSFNEYKILDGKGSLSKESADKKALAEYKEFDKTQPIESDFEKAVKRMIEKEKPK